MVWRRNDVLLSIWTWYEKNWIKLESKYRCFLSIIKKTHVHGWFICHTLQYNNNVIEEGRHAVLSARQQWLSARQVHWQWTWRADNHCWRADNSTVWPELQSRCYYYHHIELLCLHSPGCDREKTAPSSWPSIVKRCGRDTVVCIVDTNNIDGHPIRKIVAEAFIRQTLWGPVTWQPDNVRYSGEQADNDVAYTIRQSKNKLCFIDTWLKWWQGPSDCPAMWW